MIDLVKKEVQNWVVNNDKNFGKAVRLMDVNRSLCRKLKKIETSAKELAQQMHDDKLIYLHVDERNQFFLLPKEIFKDIKTDPFTGVLHQETLNLINYKCGKKITSIEDEVG